MHPIDNIVVLLKSLEDQKVRGRHSIVVVDSAKNKVIDEPRVKLLRRLKYYCVNFEEYAEHVLAPIVLRDSAGGQRAAITVEYIARCEEDRERRLVETLVKSDNPGQFVDDRIEVIIKRAVQEKNNANLPFLSNFDSWRDDVQARIADELRLIGLAVNVRVSLHQRHSDQAVVLSEVKVVTRLKDILDKIHVSLDVRIEVDPKNRTAFLLSDDTPEILKQKIIEWVQDFLTLQVSLSEIDTEKRSVTSKLSEMLQENLVASGRKLIQFDFHFELPGKNPERQTNFIHETLCLIKDRAEPVQVQHKVLLRLKDLGKYVAARSEDPVEEIKNSIDRATEAAVFNTTYVELIKAFNQPAMTNGRDNSVVPSIKDRVQEHASNFGYSVEQLLAVPDEKPNRLQRDGISCELKRVEYDLKDARIKGQVHIRIEAQMPDLECVEKYLQPNVDLEEEIIRRSEREVQRVLLQTLPHRFHTEFSSCVSDVNQKAVSNEIAEAIELQLRQEFSLPKINISVRMGETPLSERFKNLAKGQQEARVKFLVGTGEKNGIAQGDHGAEDMIFTVRYAIDGIDGDEIESWYRFQARDYENADEEVIAINAVLNDELRMRLNQLPFASLRSIEFQRDDTQGRIRQILQRKIIEDFGISITVSNIVREDSATDDFHRQAAALNRGAKLKQLGIAYEEQHTRADYALTAYTELFTKRHQIALENPNDKDLAHYDQLLKEMQKEIKPEGSHAAMIASSSTAPSLPKQERTSVRAHLDSLTGKLSEDNKEKIEDTNGTINQDAYASGNES